MARQTNFPHLVRLRLSDELATGIDEWRRAQPDIPTRSEAVKRLIASALNGGGGAKKD
jgi:hypothetical protein